MADTNIACNFDFKEMLNQHIESGADVTAAYTKQPIPEGVRSSYEKTKLSALHLLHGRTEDQQDFL